MNNSSEKEQARAVALLMGQAIFPIAIFIAYGIYRLVQEGLRPEGWPNGLVLVAGGILSGFCIIAFSKSLEAKGQSVKNSVSAFLGFIPYIYFCYIVFYVGIWSLVQQFTIGFSVSGLLIGLFGILLGYRGLSSFYMITEIAKNKE